MFAACGGNSIATPRKATPSREVSDTASRVPSKPGGVPHGRPGEPIRGIQGVRTVRSTTKRRLVTVAVLIVGGCASAYLWIAVGVGQSEVDPVIAAAMESFTCDKCGHVFEMSVGDIIKMRRARGNVFCPACGEPGARKNIVSTHIELTRPTITEGRARRVPEEPAEDEPKKPEMPKPLREKIEDEP